MQLDAAVLRKLDISEAVASVTAGHFDRFPPLLMDRCLADAKGTLAEWTVSSFRAGRAVHSETLTMPRRGFGPRPVTITGPDTRALYRALVEKLSTEIPASRASGNWVRHEKFGMPDPESTAASDYLVEFDIASCYEYIDHATLGNELLVRTMDVTHTQSTIALLSELFPRGRGLPQLTPSSDILADAYLDVMERDLLRITPSVSRFADDFKVIMGDWGSATAIIEEAAELARGLGLILSTEKTHIWKSETLRARLEDENNFLNRYFQQAIESLKDFDLIWGDYGAVDAVDVDPGEEETVQVALRRMFEDWFNERQDADLSRHTSFIPVAFGVLSKAPERIPDDWIVEVVFRQPLRLEKVSAYLLSRPEVSDNWRTLQELVQMPRQSPWAKIWLLHVANELGSAGTAAEESVRAWARMQISDKHEVVRAEAAWHLANRQAISDVDLSDLYRGASTLTRPSLAAVCGAANIPNSSGLVKAVKQDSKLTMAAYNWAAIT